MNPDTMTVAETMFIPSVTSAIGKLCPNMRRVPQIGSLFAEMAVMPVLLLRLPLVVIVASPVIIDLLTGPCFKDSMGHSLLSNCGGELFSLEKFFDSAYRCNGHFWRILSKIADVMSPGFVQTFINGVAAVGENSGATAFMPGVMGSASKIGGTDAGGSSEKVQDVFGGGDGERMGRFGPIALFMKVSVNPIAATHWMWRMGSRMLVQIIQAAKQRRGVGSVFWNVVYDGRLDYKELIATRMFNTCGGLALMAGYTSPLGQMTLHYCFAGVKSSTATLDLVSVFLVDVPVMACICSQGEGRNPADWIVNHCDSPDGLRPMLRTIMDKRDQCGAALKQTTDNLTGVFDDVFGEMFAGTTYVGSILDSLLASIDPGKAGSCDNYESNPYVVTLIPEPVDYWRVCGTTTFCKLRCQQQIEAFEAMKPSGVAARSSTSSQVVESLLFPSINQDTYNPFLSSGIVALTEMSDCEALCQQPDDRCLLVAGFPGRGGLLVSVYCVPSSIARGVSKSESWESPGISGRCVDIQFVSAGVGGGWMSVYGVVGLQDQLIQACLSAGCQEFVPTDAGPNVIGFERMQSLDSSAVVQVRTSDSGYQSYKLEYSGVVWSLVPQETNIWVQDLYHVVITSQTSVSDIVGGDQTMALLIPYAETPLQVCYLVRADNRMDFSRCVQYDDFERQNVPVKTSGKQSRVSRFVSSKKTTAFTVFISSDDASHWLRILSIQLTGTTARGFTTASIPATVTTTNVQTCSLNSCIGCTRLAVQRLCFAAQQCQVARCIGSQVNQLRPLCAVGGVTESTFFAMLSAIQGVWSIIASTLVTILRSAGGLNPPQSIDWPDQVFYGLVCSMKDIVASQVSVITSTVNGIIQASVPVAATALGEPVDNRFLAMFSLTMTSVTNFLFQLCLGPLYAAIAAQKVVVCQANSLLGVIAGDNHISIGDPEIQNASGAAAGICMTQVFSENSQGTNSGMDNAQAAASGSSQLLLKLGGLALSLPLDAMKHPLDVMFTYAQGVILGLQDILQTVDQRNCRAPDFTTRVLYKCPCGDHPAKIPEYRQRQTYMDGAFWCSTVMAMLNFDGSVKYVWNPFSLHQLKEMLVDLDAYLECVASKNDASCTSMTPRNDVFERQQISLLSVYQRCLTNYQEMTWDQGTYVLFNGTLQGLLLLDMPLEIRDTFGVAKCLLEQRANGYDNVGCMRDYFLKGTQPMDYFEYGNITIANPPSKMVDACLTFSGPAELPNPATAAPFQACLESYANRSGCDIPHMLWSGRSTNKVPVATQHAMKITDDGERERWARNMMAAEKDSVSKAIQSLAGWNGTNIRISVFSAEGDIMHQYADCVMMGPMPSATLTPGPDSVEKVVWARGGGGRLFDLPCSGAKLANRNGIRDTQAPYTCGTFPRRAVIKYYLRERFGGMRDSANARDMVVNAVKQMINQTRDAWTDDLNYQCTCANGTTTGWGCCEEQSKCSVDPCACPAGFEVPASVACCKDVCGGLAGNGLMGAFSYINGSDLAVELLEGMGTYLRNEIWTSNEPWLKYDPLGEQAFRESWEASKFAVIDAGLFDASSPVVTYEEFNYPFKSTMWKHCAGLMQQVMWTMPVDSASKRPRMPSTEYNPMAKTSNTINITYTEEFIQSITLQAYKSSPLYWHYGARYAPSASEVCKRATPNAPGNGSSFSVGKRTAARFGYSSMTLGGLGGADCYCGWWEPSGGCRIPETLCEALVQIVGFLRVCLDQQRHYNSTDHSAVLRAIETLTARQPVTTYSCPSLQISEHWGFMGADGLPLANATGVILTEGVAGFRKGNTEWLFDTQSSIINPKTRISQAERGASHVALECDKRLDSSIADHFVEDLFPVAQGVRQSMPQTYCTRYGVELARLTVYREARLAAAIGQQEGVVDKWRERCQYKLEELAVCNLHRVTAAYNASHRSTSHCPFTLQVDGTVLNSYSVTPGCLLIVWNTPKSDGIYDPCTCLALRPNSGRTCAGNLNINTGILTPATFLVPDDLLTSCMMRGLQDLVGESVVPGETAAKVPIGSGSFASLMDKSSLKINTQERSHWAIHKEIWDADFIQDWWPDEWRFPAGYHVTPGCSRPNDSSWKTFDSSWRWDATLNRMVLATDATNDALLRRNAFGASGACRTSNYGMPMTGLNTMAACTKENADAKADPMVPPPAQQTAWVDGQEFCAPDSFSTPWDVDRQSNPPRQWTVGTLQQESGGLLPLDFADWGSACGPYPLQTCRSNQECAADLQCLKSMGVSVGVCANTKSEVFDCAEHSHCTGDTMCAGDGKCVAGVWKVSNTLGQDISFRTHSQQCPTGNPASTWGTSVAELVPDILKSSGLCSFRAWYENRKMASENQCTQGSCAGVKGALPWNFTDHRSSNSAFDDGVLKVNAHACDREYQFYEGFVACTPKDEFMELFRNDAAQPKPAPRDTRTRTYRTDRTLPLVSLTNGALTKGFTGIPKTYNELNLGRDTTMVRPCSQVNVCGLQSDFMVNGKRVTRQVLDAGVAREYAVTDMINCGSFGYMGTGSSVCQLDFAVVPLAYFFARYAGSLKSQSATAPFVNLKRSTSYNPGAMNIAAYFLELKQLPDLLIREYVGALPETLAAYMDGVDRFVDLHAKLSEPPKPIYEEAGSPKQIYYVTKMGVYEVPFAWWYRCIWLTGYSMDVYEIGNEACPALAGTPSSPSWPDVVFHPHSNRLLGLLNVPPSAAMPTKPVKLVDALKQLPGVISKRVFGKVAAEFKTNRDSWLKKLDPMVANTIKKCYSKKVYLREFSSQSQEYQLDQINQYMTGRGFDLIKSYVGTQNQTVCENEGCVKSADPVISSLSTPGQFGARVIAKLMDARVDVKGTALLSGPADTSETGYVFISGLATSAEIPESFWAALGSAYQNVPDGCATRISAGNSYKESVGCACSDWGECSAMLKSEILLKSGIPHQPVDAFSTVVMEGMGIVNVCDPDFPRAETCFPTAHTLIPGSNYSQLSKVNLPIGVSLETFQQSSWDCARFSCTDTSNSYHNSVKSIDISFMPTTTHEMVVMNEVSFVQKTFSQKTRPWSSMSEQGSELLLYDQRPGLGPDEVYCMPSSDGGDPDRSMPFREVAEGPEFRLKVYTYHYYVNGVKAAVLETHPCVEDIPLAGDPTKKQSDHWPVLVSTMGKFNGYRPPYGSAGICNTKGIGGLVPSADALFATATPRNFTTYSPAGSSMSSMQQVASRIQNVLSVIQSQLAQGDSECLQNSQCEVRQDDLQASARITNTYASNDPQMQDFCSSMKSDPLYGCIMYPGEAVTQEKRCGRYSALKKAACSIPNSPIPGTGKDWWPCTWSQFYRCLNDASDDKCYDGFSSSDGGEITKQFRSMKPTGKRVVFDLKTTTRQCTHGPVMRCKLSDEINSVQPTDRPGLCPNAEDGTLQRTRLYNRLKLQRSPPTIVTDITKSVSLSGESSATATTTFATGEVDHVLLAMNPGYTCSLSTPACPASEMPVQMRRHLWRCARCPMVSETFCIGQHNCLMETPGIPRDSLNTLDGWDNLTIQERAFLTTSNATTDVAISAVRWLVGQVMQLAMTGVGMGYDIPDFMRTYGGSDFTYSPLSVIAFSNAMESRAQTCTSVGVIPVFTNCSYDTNRRSLRDFVGARYKLQDGVVISNQSTMVWNVIRAQMTSQNIPTWLATGGKAGMFWENLFDDKWCKRGNMEDSACYITNGGTKTVVEVLNPGLLGDFEPMMGCDTKVVNGQRVVNAMCPACAAQEQDLLLTEGTPMPCPQYYQTVTGVTSNLEADSNLCGKAPAFDSTCENPQGMLGQTAFDGNPIRSVYSRVPWRGGLPPGIRENPLFRGAAPGETVSNLMLKPTDIGGHCLSLEIRNARTGPTMSIVELPLSSYSDIKSAYAVRDGTGLKWMQINAPAEIDAMRTLYPNSACGTWDCPLRRRAFYSGKKAVNGKSSQFRPLVPDPLRAQVLFGSPVHPTQRAVPLPETVAGTVRTLGVFYTSNGFCACMAPPCSLCKSDEDALNGVWQTATAGASACSNQMDWPFPGGALRDKSTYRGNLGSVTCGILDRLPPFKYRYVNTKRTTPSAKTTLDQGGVCHMGWPVSAAIPSGCYLLPDTDKYVCQRGIPSPVNRLRAKTVDELLQPRQRPRLAECEPPPAYVTGDGKEVRPEVSYGVMKRLETSRLLAIDLRRKLCGNNSVCAPSAEWELSSFWSEVYMKDFPGTPGGDGANQTLWDQPWAACKQHPENQTQTCEGTIKRADWVQGNRTDLCLSTIRTTSIANDLAQPINICDLDQDMDAFCRSIQDARYRVFEANCLYSGQCRQKLFFYQPSTYSVDNAQFVRSTVQQFYDSTVAGACVPDLDTAAAILANAENIKNCAALTLTTLADCIQVVRVIMDSLVEIVFYVGNLFLYVFEMLVAGSNDDLRVQIIQRINAILQHIKNSFLQLFNAFGDLIYKVLFDGPMGQWVMTVIVKICEFLNWFYMNVVQPLICWVREAVLYVLDPIGTGFVRVINAIAFNQLGYLNTNIADAKKAVRQSMTCNNKSPLNCNISFRSKAAPRTTMPLATRCWAGAEPGVNSFACTAADTCLNNDFSKVVCGACPAASSMIKFGCNTMTKLCSCNIFVQDTSFCSSHEECTMDDSNVQCEFVDSYLQPSYGHTPCRQCPKPVCLISDGTGVGRCTCLLRPIPNQGCVGLGEQVSPSAASLCLVATAGGGQGASSTYTHTYRTLASAPCMLLNQATSYCMQVYTSATASAPMVVGLALLKTSSGRRLLQTTEQLRFNASEWGGEGEPCRALVAANESDLGILERYTLGECWRWRDIGTHLVADANMSAVVKPTFLVSWRDLLDTMLSEGALPEILSKLPHVIHQILLHTEAAQPVYVTLLYWTSFLPQEVWFNQTVLDQTRQFLVNYSESPGGRHLLASETKKFAGVHQWDQGPYGWMPHQIYWNLPGKRHLLQAEPAVEPTAAAAPSAEMANVWTQGPYTWPPNFHYWKGEQSCAVVSTAMNVVKNGLDVTMKFYQDAAPGPKKVTWPGLPFNDDPHLQFQAPASADVGEAIRAYADQVLNKTYVEEFLDNAPYAAGIRSLIQCNFTRIQTCHDRYDLLGSVAQVIVVMLAVGFVGKLLEIPYVEVLLFVFFVPLVMYSAYGYALTCAPLVPVCALRDLIAILDYFIPESVVWPDALVQTPGCTEVSCMKSCVDGQHIGFLSWNDHAAWALCELLDSKACLRIASRLAADSPLKKAIAYKLDPGDDPASTRAARWICFAVTLANSAPALLTLLLVLWVLPSALGVLVSILQFSANMLFTFVLFVHDGHED